jgi:hemolysin III
VDEEACVHAAGLPDERCSVTDRVTTDSPARPAANVLETVFKPRLRGWLHAGVSPLVLAAGVVLICLAPGGRARWSAVVYTATALLLFVTSAVYHRGTWSPGVAVRLKRFDHANVYLLIAGSYTPVVVLGLPQPERTLLLWGIWIGALLGVLFRVYWTSAPRALYTVLYIVLGWCLAPVLGTLQHQVGTAVVSLVVTGGGLYTLGAIVYATKRPNPSPSWFGFHEVFHALTIAAWTVQYVAISLLILRLR